MGAACSALRSLLPLYVQEELYAVYYKLWVYAMLALGVRPVRDINPSLMPAASALPAATRANELRDGLELALYGDVRAPGDLTPFLKVFTPEGYDEGAARGKRFPCVLVLPAGGFMYLITWREANCNIYRDEGAVTIFLRYNTVVENVTLDNILQQVIRAFRVLHAKADAWALDGSRIGLAGMSAGGHLAAMMATRVWERDPMLKDTDVELGDPRAAKPFEAVPRPAFVILWYAGYWTESEVYGGGETVAPGESLWVPTNNRMTYFGPFNGATRRKQAWEVRVHASTRSLPPMFVYHCDEDSVVSGAAREFVATARALGHTQVGCCFLERELQGMAGNHDAAPHFQKKTADTEPVSSTKNGGKLNVFSAATIEWMRHSGFLDARGKGQEENS